MIWKKYIQIQQKKKLKEIIHVPKDSSINVKNKNKKLHPFLWTIIDNTKKTLGFFFFLWIQRRLSFDSLG